MFSNVVFYCVYCYVGSGPPLVAAALFGPMPLPLPSLWGCIDMGWRDQEGFWTHPAASDSALHLAAAAKQRSGKGLVAATAIGCYAPNARLEGKHQSHHIFRAFRVLVIGIGLGCKLGSLANSNSRNRAQSRGVGF